MAGYSFETMGDSDAAAFGPNDYLFFITKGASANQVTVAPYNNGSTGSLSGSGVTLTYGGKSLTFNTNISGASTAGHILFNDASHLVIGSQAGSTGATPDPTFTHVGSANDPNTIYALGGADVIDMTSTAGGATAAGASSSNYLNGGFGADTINGGAGNNHIYGNSQGSQVGAVDPASGLTDGADTITVGGGSNYINGNAGADIITVGAAATNGMTPTAASTGFNRVFGGADNDTINILGNGHNAVNGNTGNDVITDSGFGDNTLRGGSGDDIISGGSGHSVLMGDVGNDYILVHGRNGETLPSSMSSTNVQQHIDVITGGAGSDTFDFTGRTVTQTTDSSGNVTQTVGNAQAGAGQAALFGQTVYYQEITDFTIGTDKIHLTTNPTQTGDVGHSTTVFGSVSDAEAYAQAQLSGTGFGGTHVVESLAVGSANNTYLFYAESGNVAVTPSEVAGLGIIHLDNVTASSVSYTDFNTSASIGTGSH
jgi:hypothetical protein